MMYDVLKIHICIEEKKRINNFSETLGGRPMERRPTILKRREREREEQNTQKERKRVIERVRE